MSSKLHEDLLETPRFLHQLFRAVPVCSAYSRLPKDRMDDSTAVSLAIGVPHLMGELLDHNEGAFGLEHPSGGAWVECTNVWRQGRSKTDARQWRGAFGAAWGHARFARLFVLVPVFRPTLMDRIRHLGAR